MVFSVWGGGMVFGMVAAGVNNGSVSGVRA